METNKDKSWLSFQDQIKLLRSRGMLINDEDRALRYLQRVGYYRLSGYSYPFRKYATSKTRQNFFVEGSKFDHIIDLFVFDKKLRLLALDALERIEFAIRVDIAYLLGEKGALAHLDAANFIKTRQIDGCLTLFDKWKQNYNSKLLRSKRDIIIQHYKNKHNGNVPIWVGIEFWDFGTLSTIFSLMKGPDKLKIAAKYNAERLNSKYIPLLEQWLRSLNYIRNVSAHHARLWNISLVDRSDAPMGIFDAQTMFNNEKPFYYFVIMKSMLDVISPNSKWGDRFIAHLESFPKGLPNDVSLEQFGLIENWEKLNVW